MAVTSDLTTLVCLFHHRDQAQAALSDLAESGLPQSSISVLDHAGSENQPYAGSSLQELGVPERDRQHLTEGVQGGGTIVAVSAVSDHVDVVESIFEKHKAEKIDEAGSEDEAAGLAGSAAIPGLAGAAAIPVIEEELVVGKRTVDQGGVRVYRRVVEIPVHESVDLREEHVNVERHAVDRPVTDEERAFRGDHTIELTETAEQAVVGKTARVVEEVLVGKDTTQRTEHIRDTVRKTQVEVEEIAPDTERIATNRTF